MRANRTAVITLITVTLTQFAACKTTPQVKTTRDKHPSTEGAMALQLTSSAFKHQGEIPTQYTCEGEDTSVPLHWTSVPAGTKSLALIVEDPDAPDPAAPKMTWVHWVLYDLPTSATSLPAGVASAALPSGTRQGINSWKRTGYGGPCPPIGRHRYFHRLYALDVVLGELNQPDEAKLRNAMASHILAETELVGMYKQKQ